jgi:1-acyl-sn-glycerol-3-phosphate acyltransferase
MTPPASASFPASSATAELATGWTQRAAAAFATWLARTFCSLDVRGREHLPLHEPFLLCANHTSHADTFALACATGPHSRRLVFLAARDYFSRFRVRSWLLRRLICLIPFERGTGMAAAKHNLSLLGASRDASRIIVLFPEGTRSPDGVLRDFKPGVAMFAEKLSLRVVPCHIAGAHAIVPKGKTIPRPHPLRVTFGAPLSLAPSVDPHETGAARSARYQAFAAQLHARIAALGPTPPQPPRPPAPDRLHGQTFLGGPTAHPIPARANGTGPQSPSSEG